MWGSAGAMASEGNGADLSGQGGRSKLWGCVGGGYQGHKTLLRSWLSARGPVHPRGLSW